MTKIPVGKTIAYGYGFTFGNFLTVLGLSWVPLVVVAATGYFTIPAYFGGLQAMLTTGDASALFTAFGLMFLFFAVMFAAFIMSYVAIARQALRLRSGPALFYFSLDSAFWRLLIAYLLTFLIVVGLMILVAIVSGVLSVVVGPIASVVVLIAAIGMIYVLLRMIFLQAPVAVAEGRQIVSRSWSLTTGNFWRIFGVLAAIIVPLIIVQFAIQIAFFSSLTMRPPPENASPAETAAFMAKMATQMVALFPYLLPIGVIFNAAFIAMVTSASAFAYRSLVPAPEGAAAEFA